MRIIVNCTFLIGRNLVAKSDPPKKNDGKEKEEDTTGIKEVSWDTHEEHDEITGLGDSYHPGPDQPR